MADTLIVRGAEQLNGHLGSLSRQVPMMRQRMLMHAGEAIRSYMVANYLEGQRLRRRTGNLADNWSTVVSGDTAVVGTAVQYAAVHEFGFTGDVQVKSHPRRPPRANTAIASRHGYEASYFLHWVRAHSRHVNVPAKHYARDAARFGVPDAIAAADHQVKVFLAGEMGGSGI